jgi:hypothetical protein
MRSVMTVDICNLQLPIVIDCGTVRNQSVVHRKLSMSAAELALLIRALDFSHAAPVRAS